MLRLTLIIAAMLLFASLQAQKITLQDRIKAEHIYNFGVYVNWKKNKSFSDLQTDQFRIGICSRDTSMYFLMKRICRWRMLKWKKIEVIHFRQPEEIRYVQILYVGTDYREQVDVIDGKLKEWPTLLVTDSCHSYSQVMINFFPRNALKKVEINKEIIESRGMKASPLLFTVAKKYEEDWEVMFLESEEQLALEKELVEKQQQILDAKTKEINQKELQIQDLAKAIEEKEKHLAEQKVLLAASQADLKNKMQQIAEKSRILSAQSQVIKGQEKDIAIKKQELTRQAKEYEKQKQVLDTQKAEIDQQQELITSQKNRLSVTLENMKKQQLILYFLGVVVILIAVLAVIIYRSLRMKKRINAALKRKNVEIFHQKEEIQSQRDEIEAQRDEITAQRDLVITQKKQIEFILSEITDSIHYAGRIQNAILPTKARWGTFPFEHFVMYHPRDIISGDFYWFDRLGNHVVFAVADCTGHGVPGAFMSMLGVAALNDAVKNLTDPDPAAILNRTRDYLINALNQSPTQYAGSSVKDGMDIALCSVNLDTLEMKFAGANNPLYLVSGGLALVSGEVNQQPATRNQKLVEIKGDKMPIGLHVHMESFSSHKVQLHQGDCLYLFSDGMADQFGGPKNKKYKYKQLKEVLTKSSLLPMPAQKETIETEFIRWKGKGEQMDDVTLIGIKI